MNLDTGLQAAFFFPNDLPDYVAPGDIVGRVLSNLEVGDHYLFMEELRDHRFLQHIMTVTFLDEHGDEMVSLRMALAPSVFPGFPPDTGSTAAVNHFSGGLSF